MAKRKDPPSQSTTLLNFFSPDTPATKKGKKRPTPSKSSTKIRPPNASHADPEVIIIDSDSDAEFSELRGKGKGKARALSSEAEILDGPALVGKVLMPKRSAGSRLGSAIKREESAMEVDIPFSFGKPILLVSFDSTKREPVEQASPLLCTAQASPRESDGGPVRPSICPTQGASSSISNFKDTNVIDLSDDEWAMGDDEMALADPEDFPDDETGNLDMEVDIRPVKQEPREGNSCPVCATNLDRLLPNVSVL